MKFTKSQLENIIKEEVKAILEQDNPWAICTASVGRDDKQKYERCVKSVKKQLDEAEEVEKLGTSDARKKQQQLAKDVGASGVTNLERGLIDALQQRLIAAAEIGNIGTGKILSLSRTLAQEIVKLMKSKGADENGEEEMNEEEYDRIKDRRRMGGYDRQDRMRDDGYSDGLKGARPRHEFNDIYMSYYDRGREAASKKNN